MDTVADYEAWKAKQRKSGVGAAAMVLGSVDTAPDQLAGDLQLATEFGKVTGNPVPPAPMVQEYRSVFQQAIEKTRAETILSSAPRLTEWLRNPENATLARDDLEGLSWWETGLGAAGNSVKRAALSVPQAYNQAMAGKFAGDAADLQRGFGDLVYDEREPVFKDGKEVARLWATPTDVLGAAWRWGTSRWSGLVTDPAADAAVYEMRAAELQGRIAGMAMSPGAQAIREKLGTVTGTWQEQLSQFGALIAEDPLGFASFIGQVGLESAPAIGLSTAVGVATRSPTAAAATMGALSGAREYGASAGDVVAQSGYDLSTFEGAMAAISDEDLMRRAGETGQTRAIIIGALDGISGGVAGKVLSESPVGNMLLQTVTQALFGSGGEAAATYAAGQDFNLANVLIEGIAEAFTAPIEVGGMAVAKVRQMQAQARDAEGRVALFQELSGQAVASKLRARMPDRFRQFVDQATANGPVENVFVPAQDFVQYFQTAGIDPYALVDELDGVSRDDLDAALAGGGDLKIPTATYAAKIAGSEHDAFLMENMRFDPLDMTAKEAADFNARVDDVMQEMWSEAEDIRQDEERWRAVEEKIHDTVVSQMRAAGLSTERAMAEVQPIVAFYRTRAARMGLTTEEYLARHPLPGIQGAIPQGMQFKNVDELNRTLAEARNRRAPAVDTRQSLLEFIDGYGGINDVGGELKARDAVAVKRRGKSTLKLAREGAAGQGSMLGPNVGGKRFGADDVAQAAIEAGFMADNPLVMEYRAAMADGRETPDLTAALWDAIDAELAGQKQASVQDAAPVDDTYLDEIEGYLNRLGLDLSNTDEEIRAAIEADQAGGRMYGQSRGGFDMSRGGGSKTVKVGDTTMIYGISSDGTSAEIISVRTPASKRGHGSARQAIASFLMETDALGMSVKLAASPLDKKTRLGRLVSFYGSLGFERTGRAINAAGDPEMVRAPQKSYLQDGQIATESAAFNAWFGDSKVVDADGKPLVVYHGTDSEFEAFSADFGGSGASDRAGRPSLGKSGFYFSADKSHASIYGGEIVSAYMSLQNPVDIDAEAILDSWNVSEFGGKYSSAQAMVDEYYDGDLYAALNLDDLSASAIADAKSNGNDGVIIRTGRLEMDMAEIGGIYIAISPTQIKSVNNRGTFDPNDARILYQDGDSLADVEAVAAEVGVELSASERGGIIGVSRIVAGKRGEGAGTRVMQALAAYADATGQRIALTPSADFGGSVSRLRDFYKRFGFVENKGRNKDFETRETMIRNPKPAGRTYFQPAYHGTPHLFEKFSLDKIGTGEGAQAFGWGLYFAGRKEVAEWYRGKLAGFGFLKDGAKTPITPKMLDEAIGLQEPAIRRVITLLDAHDGDVDGVLDGLLRSRSLEEYGRQNWVAYDNAFNFFKSLAGQTLKKTPAGRLFHVEIPDDAELLDWDAPLSEQPKGITEKALSWLASAADVYADVNSASVAEREAARDYAAFLRSVEAGTATGEGLYKTLTRLVGSPDQASRELRAAGIPGHRYLDGGSRADGDGSRNYVIYDDSRVQVAGYEQRDAGPRGQIQFMGDGQSIIRLFETANLSTLQHEMGHLFLTMLQRDAADGDAATVAEYENVKSWWRGNAAAVADDGNRAMPDAKITAADVMLALDGGTTGDIIKDAAIDVGMQEQWARGYEAYLMEGKAPSVELRSVFAKFRSWMISVYKSLTGLNVKITPEIRAVFDRMLATDEEIAKAQASSGETRGLFTTAEQMGLTEEEFARFVKLRVQAEDEAKARLQVEIMEPIRRETEKWWKDERASVTEETERRINAMPVFRAMEWLGNRRWLGDGQPEAMSDMRMSKSVLVDRYGDGVLKTLPRGMQTVYAVEGGMDPDDVAGWFGFGSGDEMIRAMERAPKRGDAIKAEVDAEMYRRHGDPLKDGEIERLALDALHSDRRGEWLAAELKAVAEVAGVAVPITSKEARASAKVAVARMKVRDAVAANRFLAAERKAGEEAARLAMMLGREGVWMQNARRRIATKTRAALRDDATVDAVAGQIEQANKSTGNYNDTVQRLIEVKRRQLVNHALFMEARAVAEEVEKAERFVQKLNKATMRERIAGAGRREGAQTDYLAALDEIQDRYDFRKMSGRAEERRGALVAFVDAMKAAGRENELAVPEAVLRAANRTPYKTLTVEELRGVVDSLKNIQHIALRWNDLIDAQNQRKLDEAVAEITEAMDANLPKRPPGRVKTAGEGFRNSARQFIDLVLNASTLLREIDGFKDAGAAYRNLKAPIDEAMDRLTVRKEKAAAEMEALYAVYSKEDRRRMAVREYVPALGYSLSKWEKIAVALNTGNEGNMQRLTDPKVRGSLTEAQVRAVLASLDERDAGFIQSVWDFVGSFRDDIAARERRTTGVEPAWVDASPVQIGGKELRGGYYPLKYDPRLSSLARDDEAQAIGEALQAGRFGKAQTKRGHLEARAKSSGRDVELDMSVFHRHVNQVIYDLELSEPVANSWKVLQSGDVRQAFMDAGRQADFDALETWLKDVAEGQLAAGDWINKNARRFKSNFTAAKLAFNLGTVAAQVTGLSQTIVVVGKRDFLLGLQASFRAGIGDEIAAKSPFMRQRQTTFNKDVMDFYDDPSLGPTASRWGEIKREWIGPASFWLMTKVQWLLVDIPTWLGGYQQGLRLYANDEAKAVAHADGIVKRAQSSGLFSDRSAIERGSVSRTTRQNDVVRLFTTLGSYMFAKFNVAYERAAVGGRVIRKEGLSLRSVQEAASLTLDMAFLFTLEAVVMAAIKGRLPDDEDEEDAGWAAFLAKETAFSVLGTIPFVRDVASFGQGFEGGGAYGGIISELGKPFIEISQGEIDKGLLKSVISTTGLFTGLPASQINRAVDAAWRQAEGDDVAPVEYLLGKR